MIFQGKGSRISQKHFFPIQFRVRRGWEYRKIQKTGHKIRLKNFTVLYQTREEGPVRLGLIVSRKVGGAVQRNRVKRLVREFFRLNRERLPEKRDFVVIAKKGTHQLSYLSVAGELASLFSSKKTPSEGGKCLQNK